MKNSLHDETIKEFQDCLRDFRSSASDLQRLQRQLEGRIRKLEDDYETRISSLVMPEDSAVSIKRSDIEGELSSEEIIELKGEIRSLRKTLDDRNKELEAERNNCDSLELTLSALKSMKTKFEEGEKKFAEYDTLKQQLLDSGRQCSELEKYCEETRGKALGLKRQYENKCGEIEKYRREKVENEETVTKLQSRISELENELVSESRNRQAADKSKQELEEKAGVYEVGIQNRENQFRKLLFGDLSGESLDVISFFDETMQSLLLGKREALGFTARLMALRSCTADSAPSLLKDIGDSYYAWKPRGSEAPTAEELLLVGFLKSLLARQGIKNSIELVSCGDRFDSSVHASADRGSEISAVRGWIVTRDNGRPLIRASVSLS